MKFIKRLKARINYYRAVKMADDKYLSTGIRRFVIADKKLRLIITDRKNFRLLKRKGYINRLIPLGEAICHSVYATPDRAGNPTLSPEEIKRKKADYIDLYAI